MSARSNIRREPTKDHCRTCRTSRFQNTPSPAAIKRKLFESEILVCIVHT